MTARTPVGALYRRIAGRCFFGMVDHRSKGWRTGGKSTFADAKMRDTGPKDIGSQRNWSCKTLVRFMVKD
jgi:hypothetical protein